MFGVLRTLPLTFKKLETIQLSPLIKILEVNLVCKYRNTDFFFLAFFRQLLDSVG